MNLDTSMNILQMLQMCYYNAFDICYHENTSPYLKSWQKIVLNNYDSLLKFRRWPECMKTRETKKIAMKITEHKRIFKNLSVPF